MMNQQKSIHKLMTVHLGDAVKIIHRPNGKVSDSCIYYLKDLSAWQRKRTIAKADFRLVVPSVRIKPVIIFEDDDRFIIRHGSAFSYYQIRVRASYERPNKIESVYISKVIA